jgi:LCP family protein required for cell wall assembly
MKPEVKNETKKWFQLSKKPVQNHGQDPLFPEMKTSKPAWLRLWWLWIILVVLGLLVGTGLLIAVHANRYLSAMGLSFSEARSLVQEVQKTRLPDSGFTILMFGLDETKNQREESLLTDSIILIHVKQTGTLDMVSIPRDLWIDSLKTKINALYYYGTVSEETTGEELLIEVVREITGQEIDYYLRLNLEDVRQVIDLLGGVQVNVPRGFRDDTFPREGVDITSKDPNVLYETVEFQQGLQLMDGTRALKYIRSRQSEDLTEGTDTARSSRQQLVIVSLIETIKNKQLWRYPELAGKLYRLYTEEIETSIPLPLLARVGLQALSDGLIMRAHIIPISDENESNGLLIHPPIERYNQWVYEPADPSWKELHEYVESVFTSQD